MNFPPVRFEERVRWTLSERKFRSSDESQIYLVILDDGQFSIMIVVTGLRVALSSPETKAVLTGEPEGDATPCMHVCIASTVTVGKAGRGCSPRLKSKAKPFVTLRENVD
ncbi:unnamed protein product [Fusarium venenatum]|uniref:Uncharacterized protein n=1 Tax=Fusarium venenatum TaxID=56646 RepID=A0A2L2SNX7_9HYPO|nr:uncharacterized protein FVRRES_12067 [Fusarium venenatum]CEI39376.1 unnamed protein product [Fusarium venenatum]